MTAPLLGHKERAKDNRELADEEEEPANGCGVKLLKKYFFRQSMPFCHYSGHNLWILKATKLN